MWSIAIDTGGTFTDCIGTAPDGTHKRLKILSSSCLKGILLKQLSSTSYAIDIHWNVEEDIFADFILSADENEVSHAVESIDLKQKILHLKNPSNYKPGIFRITSGEEVPVLAARIMTCTALGKSFPPMDIRLGSTKGTNALLERKGAKVIFITTKGFKDLIKIGTQQRPDIFSLNIQTSQPLYEEVLEIEERVDTNGNVLKTLHDADIKSLLATLENFHQPVSIAIALMNSYRNPAHERKLEQLLKENDHQYISLSSSISPTIKILSRAETTVANAYLLPVIHHYLTGIKDKIQSGYLRVMNSAGAIVNTTHFNPKDSLLSGPAGGIVGARHIAENSGYNKIITFDMGGTSTDVAIYNQSFDYTYETRVGDATILSPGLSIETIAAGGGSVCNVKDNRIQVGPESAGAHPGPACYGAHGPLTITDINLLCGRLVANSFSIPLNQEQSQEAIKKIWQNSEEALNAFLNVANEKMAEAIKKISVRKGHDPADYALVTYGGAGGQHACAIAELLGIQTIIIPYQAGLLSAFGISKAGIEQFAGKQILQDISDALPHLDAYWADLKEETMTVLQEEGFSKENIYIKAQLAYLRYKGQENTVEILVAEHINYKKAFKENYKNIYGHWLENQEIEIESIKLIMAVKSDNRVDSAGLLSEYVPTPEGKQRCLTTTGWQNVNIYQWEKFTSGAGIKGPAIIISSNCTVFVEAHWRFTLDINNNAIVKNYTKKKFRKDSPPKEANLELFKNRYTGIVEKMGSQLERTSFSVNIKERLDFSCALLDAKGYLVANAPHIPVHLGSMGICVRKVLEDKSIAEGDIIITNHPAYGGSHLPDITLISGVFYENQRIGYVANRAHHAEIGGMTPGSMPTDATRLVEEGVIIGPQYLAKGGDFRWRQVRLIFEDAPFPSRAVEENMADLRGGVASLQMGITELQQLCEVHGPEDVLKYMHVLKEYVDKKLWAGIKSFQIKKTDACELMDDGSRLQVKIDLDNQPAIFDFTGTSPVHPANLNATEAIVNSVVLYTLRLLVGEDIPLNEGLLKNIRLIIPHGMLNPDFKNMDPLPAVVGGNTEVSQRLTDTLLKALELSACSQGTMNNVLFGNDSFGYYETIGGGTGAGNGYHGKDAIHQHMTNTRITDPEVMEYRYPVQLEKFAIRKNSGGAGQWHGGNGIVRQIRFLQPVQLTILSQHRKELPYGLEGGECGKTGKQHIITPEGKNILKGIDSYEAVAGDVLTIYTPGGGGYGNPNH